MESVLYYIPFSPWSLKARCALLHHKLSPHAKVYTPLIDELVLRLRLKRATGRMTVPVLVTDAGTFSDSWEIALYAERVGTGAPLIPRHKQEEIAGWNAASERLLAAGRGLTMLRTLRDPDAALEVLPPWIGKVFKQRGALLAIRQFNSKYGIHERHVPEYERTMRSELDGMRRVLSDGRQHLLGELSYADFAMAMGLNALRPTANAPMGAAMRRVAGDEVLAAEYPDLLAWRDALHAQHPW